MLFCTVRGRGREFLSGRRVFSDRQCFRRPLGVPRDSPDVKWTFLQIHLLTMRTELRSDNPTTVAIK